VLARRLFLVALAAVALAAPTDAAVGRPLATAFPGGPYFLVGCGFSHRNNDDPVVFPGQPGRSHNHTYIGNRAVTALSTPESLRGEPTTCDEPADSSTYWAPTLYEAGNAVLPIIGLVYYVRRTAGPVSTLPADLKMVAGDPNAKKAQSTDVVSWSCGPLGRATPAVPACRGMQAVQLRVDFPNCWNGRTPDSPDHKRHMAYSAAGACPGSHPVALPAISLILVYPAVGSKALLSSGKLASHADFINGWNQERLAALTAGINYSVLR
jgi:hypothetical protein